MKKTLLLLLLPLFSVGQTQFSFGFDGTTAAMVTAGWTLTNQSSPVYVGAPNWSIASYVPPTTSSLFGSTSPQGQAGGLNSLALVNYTSTGTSSTAGTGTISNWLISPAMMVQNGDVVSFWTRKGTDGTTDYPDRLELRMSSAASHLDPTGGSAGIGSFTTVGVTVNPSLVAGFVYPQVWTQYSYTVAGLTGLTSVKFGFRYWVTSGGAGGANSDIIGIDTFLVNRPLSTEDFFATNFSMYPNPVSDVFNITSKNGSAIESIQILDINGRIVNQIDKTNNDTVQLNIASLNDGVYFVKVKSELGVGTSRIIKN